MHKMELIRDDGDRRGLGARRSVCFSEAATAAAAERSPGRKSLLAPSGLRALRRDRKHHKQSCLAKLQSCLRARAGPWPGPGSGARAASGGRRCGGGGGQRPWAGAGAGAPSPPPPRGALWLRGGLPLPARPAARQALPRGARGGLWLTGVPTTDFFPHVIQGHGVLSDNEVLGSADDDTDSSEGEESR